MMILVTGGSGSGSLLLRKIVLFLLEKQTGFI